MFTVSIISKRFHILTICYFYGTIGSIPIAVKELLLNRTFGCSRVVYNSVLVLKKDLHAKDRSTISDTELNRKIVTENLNSWIKG